MKSPFSNLKFEARGNANVGSNPTQMQENKNFVKAQTISVKFRKKKNKECQTEIVKLIREDIKIASVL